MDQNASTPQTVSASSRPGDLERESSPVAHLTPAPPQTAHIESKASTIPVMIGVTGHRDIRPQDTPALKAEVGKIFEEHRKKYPATPLLVMSPLAEGADRLVAEVALEKQPDDQSRALLTVPLPLPKTEYRKDFDSSESKEGFDHLIQQASKCFELPLVKGNTAAGVQVAGPERDKQYAQVGAYIARHSHIMIALWDGEPTEDEGGTGHIVEFKLRGVPEPYAPAPEPLDIVDSGPVYHVVTPRRKNPSPKDTPFKLRRLYPEGWESSKLAQASYERIFERMNGFNHDVDQVVPKLDESVKNNRARVIPDAELSQLSEPETFILDRYAVADTLAMYFQTRRRLTLITLFAIAVLAVLSFEVYAHLLSEPYILALYPLSLLTAVSIYLWARRKDFQNKHLDYRALAEGLRVQLFWSLAGLPDEVDQHYLRQHRTELEWIRNAIRTWNALAKHGCVAGGSFAKFSLVLSRWVEDQRGFFEKRTKENRSQLSPRERATRSFFWIGVALAFLALALHFLWPEFSEPSSHFRHWLVVIMGITPAIAAAIGGYAEKMAFSAQAKRYEWMNALFNRAATRLSDLLEKKDYAGARRLVFDLGKEALEENGDWVMIHRERTVDVYRGA